MSGADTTHREIEIRVELRDLPVVLHRAYAAHVDELVRELQLVSADPADTPAQLLRLGATLRRRTGAVADAISAAASAAASRGEHHVDLGFRVWPSAAALCRSLLELLDECDQWCREGGLLTLAAAPDIAAYRRWLLGEFIHQVEGAAPLAWTDPARPARPAQPHPTNASDRA